jgi:A/G-specific adenine glycosylase
VDGNVARALSRWLGEPWLLTRQRDRKALEAAALELQSPRSPGAFNEALIELGAMICKPRSPDCAACPVSAGCRALAEDRVAELPPPKPKQVMADVEAVAAFVLRRGRVLLQRRSEDEAVLPGMWELPGGYTEAAEPVGWLEESVLPALGGGRVGERLLSWKHVITNRRITVHVHEVELTATPRSGKRLRWTALADTGTLPLTGTTANLLERLLPR